MWSTGATSSSITVTIPGKYTVTQTINGLTSAAGAGIAAPKAIPTAPEVTVKNNCGSSTLSTTAIGKLLWNTHATTSSVKVTEAGFYTVTRTVNGCTSDVGVGNAAPKVIPPAPEVTVTNSCGSSTLSTTATGKLLWSTGTSLSLPFITVDEPGIYSVTQTTNGCISVKGTATAAPLQKPHILNDDVNITDLFNSCSKSVNLKQKIDVTGKLPIKVTYKIGTQEVSSPYEFPDGTTVLTVTATNSCGSDTKEVRVNITEKVKPLITCPRNAVRDAQTYSYAIAGKEFNAIASDKCGVQSLTYRLGGANKSDYSPEKTSLEYMGLLPGITDITWKATDASGNTATCNIRVEVKPNPEEGGPKFGDPESFNGPVSNATGLSAVNGATQTDESKPLKISLRVMPNPSSYYFTLKLNSKSTDNFKITVTDITGRIIEQKTNITAQSTIRLGNNYLPGAYIAEIMQGNERIAVKLVKTKR